MIQLIRIHLDSAELYYTESALHVVKPKIESKTKSVTISLGGKRFTYPLDDLNPWVAHRQ